MATAAVTNTFVDATTIVAAAFNTNFTDLVTFLNGSVVHVDGSKAMTGALAMGANKITGLGAPTAGTDAATKTYVDTAAAIGARATKSANQAIANITHTSIAWDVEAFDTDAFHDNVTNNTRFTIPAGKAGKYLIVAKLLWAASVGGNQRRLLIAKNGIGVDGVNVDKGSSAINLSSTASAVVDLIAGDYIEVQGYQDTGGALNVLGGAGNQEFSNVSIVRVGV